MSLNPICRRVLHGCNTCPALLLALTLLVTGCAGKRMDLFTSLDEIESAEMADADPDVEESQDETSLIAGDVEEKHSNRLAVFSRQTASADGDEIPRTTLRRRIRSMFGRGSDDELVTTDPFIEDNIIEDNQSEETPTADTSETKSIAREDGPTVEELLASFESKPRKSETAGLKPWWERGAMASPKTDRESAAKPSVSVDKPETQEFAQEFDSRLDRLRAELATVDSETDTSPFVNDELPQNHTERSLISGFSDSADSLFGENNTPLISDSGSSAGMGGAKSRIKAMLADSRRDRENWNLRRAYRTALDAQEIAVLENVSFLPGEERPQELANLIADDLRNDAVSTVSSSGEKTESVKQATNPFAESEESNPFATAAKTSTSSPIGFPEFGNDTPAWNSLSGVKTRLVEEASTAGSSVFEESPSSGVSLLPPKDDFPSEADGTDWGGDSKFPKFDTSRAAIEGNADKIQLTMHKSPGFTLTRSDDPREQVRGLTEDDNQDLLSVVAEQRSRVFDSKNVEWPSLPSPNQVSSHLTTDRGPIRVAQAPKFALDNEMGVATAAPFEADPAVPQSGSLLGQFWRSQPVWFIGGLVLLIIALRLLPWPRHESA